MRHYRRAEFSLFSFESEEFLDVASLLKGDVKVNVSTTLYSYSPLSATKHAVTAEDLEVLQLIPSDCWMPEPEVLDLGLDSCRLAAFARHGLVLSDAGDPELTELKRRHEVLQLSEWHPHAAFYHFMTRATERPKPNVSIDYASMEMKASERASQFVEKHGPSPPPFHSIPGAPRHELPLVEKQGELYNLLRRRQSTRNFDSESSISFKDFSTLLYFTFGCHGVTYLSPEVPLLHRTSPSGGSRHPVEAYSLVLQVEGLAVGIYHYDAKNHALELVKEYDLEVAKALAVELAANQECARSAHALFIMTARFFRNFWKYRQRSRSYSVILMDAAHLSQTLYLIAADLGLGIFFSAAINGPKVDEALGIDGYEEGAVAVCGCGVKARPGVSRFELDFLPFTPRITKV